MLSLILLLSITSQVVDTNQSHPLATVEFLHRCLNEDGSYRDNPTASNGNLANTSAALRALKHWKGTPRHLDKTKAYVWSCFEKNAGQFKDVPHGKASYRMTAIGIMAVVSMRERFTPADLSRIQVALLQSDQPEEIRLGAAALETLVLDGQLAKVPTEWQAKLERTFKREMQPDGTYGSGTAHALLTAGYSAAFLRLGYQVANKEGIVDLLKAAQGNTGGWANAKGEIDLEATYRVMRCLFLLHCIDKNMLDRCEKFLHSLRQTDGGYSLPGSKVSTVSATYFAGSIHHWILELRK